MNTDARASQKTPRLHFATTYRARCDGQSYQHVGCRFRKVILLALLSAVCHICAGCRWFYHRHEPHRSIHRAAPGRCWCHYLAGAVTVRHEPLMLLRSPHRLAAPLHWRFWRLICSRTGLRLPTSPQINLAAEFQSSWIRSGAETRTMTVCSAYATRWLPNPFGGRDSAAAMLQQYVRELGDDLDS